MIKTWPKVQSEIRSHKRHQDLRAYQEVDVVCIAIPDRLQVPQAIDAIRAGKDTLAVIEKG